MLNWIIIGSIVICNVLVFWMLYEVWRLKIEQKIATIRWIELDYALDDWQSTREYIDRIPVKER